MPKGGRPMMAHAVRIAAIELIPDNAQNPEGAGTLRITFENGTEQDDPYTDRQSLIDELNVQTLGTDEMLGKVQALRGIVESPTLAGASFGNKIGLVTYDPGDSSITRLVKRDA